MRGKGMPLECRGGYRAAGRWLVAALALFATSLFADDSSLPAYLQSAPVEDAASAGQPVFSREFIPYPLFEDRDDAPVLPAAEPVTSVAPTLPLPEGAHPPLPIAPRSDTAPPFDKSRAQKAARQAWLYFQASRLERSGLYDSVLGYHHSTMWDAGSALAGMASAERLHLVSRKDFLVMVRKALAAYQAMPLYDNALPNREINVDSLSLLDISSRLSTRGSGWSALDMGRILIWLRILHNWYPELRSELDALVQRWDLARIVPVDELRGEAVIDGRIMSYQEGRLGYEQYAAAGLALWGKKPERSLRFNDTQVINLREVELHRDLRGQAFLTSEPFFLAQMEVGTISTEFQRQANNLYEVQKRYADASGMLIAVTEDAMDQRPWFVYNTVNYDGEAWACVSHSGRPYPALASLSTKAAFAWWALHDDAYARRLVQAVQTNHSASKGYYAGFYNTGSPNRSLNINTNAVILEAVLFQALGQKPFLDVPAERMQGRENKPNAPGLGKAEKQKSSSGAARKVR
jgi:hypothetical protein